MHLNMDYENSYFGCFVHPGFIYSFLSYYGIKLSSKIRWNYLHNAHMCIIFVIIFYYAKTSI